MFLALCYKAVLYPSCYFLLVYSVEEWPQSLLTSHVCSDCNRGGTAYCKLHTVTTRLILCQSQTLHPRDVFFQTRSCNLLKLIFITVLMKAPHLADVVYHLNRIFRPGPKTCFDRSNVQSSPTYQGALTIRSAYFLLCCFIFCGIVLCIWGWNPAGQQAPEPPCWTVWLEEMGVNWNCIRFWRWNMIGVRQTGRSVPVRKGPRDDMVSHTLINNRDKFRSQAIGSVKDAHWRSGRSRTDAFKSPNFYTCFSCFYCVQNVLNGRLGSRPNALCPVIKKKCISCVALSVEAL